MTTTTADTDRRDKAVEQLFAAAICALELLHVYVGDRLGLYGALAKVPDATPAELAGRAGIAERYAREWLEQQAVSGLLDVITDDDAVTRRYSLPVGVAEVRTDADSLNYLVPLAPMIEGISQATWAAAAAGPASRSLRPIPPYWSTASTSTSHRSQRPAATQKPLASPTG